TVGNVLDTTRMPGSTPRIAAANGIVAVNTAGDTTFFYENIGGTLTRVRGEFVASPGLAAVPTPVTNNATAEFVATGAGTRWYGVYPQGMTPGGVTCNNGDAGSTVALCELDSVGGPTGGTINV